MTDSYPIIEVDPSWRDREDMGSKEKFWYQDPTREERTWLFKYPRPCTGEHWAEKIAEQVASALEIECAKVELATFEQQRGSVSHSFISSGEELVDGNQILEGFFDEYDPHKRFKQSSHNLQNVLKVLEYDSEIREKRKLEKDRFSRYLNIGCIDRKYGSSSRELGSPQKAD